MLSRLKEALRCEEWPAAEMGHNTKAYLEKGQCPHEQSETIENHILIKGLAADFSAECEAALSESEDGVRDFSEIVINRLISKVSRAEWPDNFIGNLTSARERVINNIHVGVFILSRLYPEMLKAYNLAGEQVDYQDIERTCMELSRILMRLDQKDFNTLGQAEYCLLLANRDNENKSSFEVGSSGVDVTEETARFLTGISQNLEVGELLALNLCPAYWHSIVNIYVKFLTRISQRTQTTAKEVESALA